MVIKNFILKSLWKNNNIKLLNLKNIDPLQLIIFHKR